MAIQNSSALTAPTPAGHGLQANSIEDLQRLARLFSASGLFGRSGNAEQHMAECAIKILAGAEAGFGPFASHNGVAVINGKPAFSANLLAQSIKRHPDYDYRVLEKTAKICRVRFLSRGELLGEETFTIEMAERAGLLKNPTWRSYPEAMLFSRALTAGMRTHCPDALGGHPAYTPEELGADDVVAVTVTEPEPPAPAPAPVPPSPTPELVNQAFTACGDAGLTGEGLDALVAELSQGEASQLDQLPVAILQRLAGAGVSAETVVRCNGATTVLDDELPAAWSS